MDFTDELVGAIEDSVNQGAKATCDHLAAILVVPDSILSDKEKLSKASTQLQKQRNVLGSLIDDLEGLLKK